MICLQGSLWYHLNSLLIRGFNSEIIRVHLLRGRAPTPALPSLEAVVNFYSEANPKKIMFMAVSNLNK